MRWEPLESFEQATDTAAGLLWLLIDQAPHPLPTECARAGLLRFMNQSSQADNEASSRREHREMGSQTTDKHFPFLIKKICLLTSLKKTFIESGDVVQIIVTCI